APAFLTFADLGLVAHVPTASKLRPARASTTPVPRPAGGTRTETIPRSASTAPPMLTVCGLLAPWRLEPTGFSASAPEYGHYGHGHQAEIAHHVIGTERTL